MKMRLAIQDIHRKNIYLFSSIIMQLMSWNSPAAIQYNIMKAVIQQLVLLLHIGRSNVQFSAHSQQAPLELKWQIQHLVCYGLDPETCLSFCPYTIIIFGGRLISCSSTQLKTMLTPIIGRVFLLNYKQYSSVSGSHWTTMLDWVINFIYMRVKTKTPPVTTCISSFKQRLYKWDFTFH